MSLTFHTDIPPIRTDADGVCRVGGTRVSLEVILASYYEGATPEEIADRYPTISVADIYATIAYYLKHREDVDSYLRVVEAAETSVIREIRARRPTPLSERLASRRGPVST